MPNRVIKESILRSEQIDSLTWFEEVVFYRLLVTADDYGCIDGRPALLKSILFPLKESVTRKAVEGAISRLTSVGLLYAYTVNGMPYLCLPTWKKHQRIRNQRSKYPLPKDFDTLTGDCPTIDGQLTDNCRPESESRIQNPNPESESRRGNSARTRRTQASFTPPTESEVAEYAREMGYAGFNAARFVDFYASKGWKVGKNGMKDWRAAARGWHARDSADGTGASANRKNPALNYQQREYSESDYGEDFFVDLERLAEEGDEA